MKTSYRILLSGLLLSLSLLIPSCRSLAPHGTKGNEPTPSSRLSKKELLNRYSQHLPPLINARGKATIHWKDNKKSSGLRCSYYPEKALILSLRPISIFEAARLWVLPDQITAIDRLNKRTSTLTETDLKTVFEGVDQLNITFLYSLLTNSPLSFQHRGEKAIREMTFQKKTNGYLLSSKRNKSTIINSFDSEGRLQEIRLEENQKTLLSCHYSDFERFSEEFPQELPTRIELSFPSTKLKGISLELRYNDSSKGALQADIEIPDAYQEISLSDLIKLLSEI